jgi:hypothetical protein
MRREFGFTGFGFGKRRAAKSGIASLFAGVQGAWYDPSDLTSMFQDSAGTTPAAVDSPVGLLRDKSGKGNHASQATASKRPTLRQAGALYYLEFDGTDDMLSATFAVTQPFDRVTGLRQITWTINDQIYGGATGNAGVLYTPGVSPTLGLFSGSAGPTTTSAAVGADACITERHSGASSRIAVNNGAYATGNAGATTPGGIRIGEANAGTGNANIRFYGCTMICRELTDAETSALRTYHGSKAGLTL